jgi:hypothetical protein
VPGQVLDDIMQREFALDKVGSSWGYPVDREDGWGVPDEQEVSVEVWSRIVEGSKESSTCRYHF